MSGEEKRMVTIYRGDGELTGRARGIGSAEFGSKEVFFLGVGTGGLVQRNPSAAQFWRSANATALHRGNISLSSSAYGLLRTVYGSDFPVPTFALPRNVALSLTTSRGASMSPRRVQPAWSSQHSVTKILPSTVPRTFNDFVLMSPRMRACSPILSVPVESIVPSTSPSMTSSAKNLIEPLIETPRERKAQDCAGMNVRLDGPGTTDGLADSFERAAGSVFRVNICIPCFLRVWPREQSG